MPPGRGVNSATKLVDVLHMDEGTPVQRSVIIWVALVGITLAAIATALLLATSTRTHPKTSDPEVLGPPAGVAPVASGTLDGIAWKQFAWASPDGSVCVQFEAGVSATNCGTWNGDGSPFVLLGGGAPITDLKHGATTVVSQGLVAPGVTSLRVVIPKSADAVAHLAACPCGVSEPGLPVFTLPLTRSDVAIGSDGKYVVLAAYQGSTELGRVRVPVLGLGYCGRDDCA